jgi:hypothetical protein
MRKRGQVMTIATNHRSRPQTHQFRSLADRVLLQGDPRDETLLLFIQLLQAFFDIVDKDDDIIEALNPTACHLTAKHLLAQQGRHFARFHRQAYVSS